MKHLFGAAAVFTIVALLAPPPATADHGGHCLGGSIEVQADSVLLVVARVAPTEDVFVGITSDRPNSTSGHFKTYAADADGWFRRTFALQRIGVPRGRIFVEVGAVDCPAGATLRLQVLSLPDTARSAVTPVPRDPATALWLWIVTIALSATVLVARAAWRPPRGAPARRGPPMG